MSKGLPLSGIRVVDLGTVGMVPYASQWLGDMGADVIKVEAPGGDSTRTTGMTPEAGMAPLFMGFNRNKRSIVLDLKQPEAAEALQRLIDDADVLVHNIRPQKLARLGLEPDAVRARNPRLVYAAFHGFEQAGPYGGRAAYDDIIQGLSGGADILGRVFGEPRYAPSVVADKTSGLIGAIAILSAVVKRERTGDGSYVEIPMFESMSAFNLVEHFYGAHYTPPSAPMGYPRLMLPSRRPFATADGVICIMPYNDGQWRAFFTEAGRPELFEDPRFADMRSRTLNGDAINAITAEIVAQRTTAAWLETCERLSIPAAPMHTMESLLEDPHLEAVGFFQTLQDERLGKVRFPGVPVKFDGERPPVALPPRLGEQGAEILSSLGLPADAPWAQGRKY